MATATTTTTAAPTPATTESPPAPAASDAETTTEFIIGAGIVLSCCLLLMVFLIVACKRLVVFTSERSREQRNLEQWMARKEANRRIAGSMSKNKALQNLEEAEGNVKAGIQKEVGFASELAVVDKGGEKIHASNQEELGLPTDDIEENTFYASFATGDVPILNDQPEVLLGLASEETEEGGDGEIGLFLSARKKRAWRGERPPFIPNTREVNVVSSNPLSQRGLAVDSNGDTFCEIQSIFDAPRKEEGKGESLSAPLLPGYFEGGAKRRRRPGELPWADATELLCMHDLMTPEVKKLSEDTTGSQPTAAAAVPGTGTEGRGSSSTAAPFQSFCSREEIASQQSQFNPNFDMNSASDNNLSFPPIPPALLASFAASAYTATGDITDRDETYSTQTGRATQQHQTARRGNTTASTMSRLAAAQNQVGLQQQLRYYQSRHGGDHSL